MLGKFSGMFLAILNSALMVIAALGVASLLLQHGENVALSTALNECQIKESSHLSPLLMLEERNLLGHRQ